MLIASTAFALWARFSLGTSWSMAPQVGGDRRLRTEGPYAVTRHPIYTGLLGMILGTALLAGLGQAILVVVVGLILFSVKIHAEERLLLATFPDEYPAYRERVPQLVPGLGMLHRRRMQRMNARSPVSPPAPRRLRRLAEQHDSDQDPHHASHGRSSRAGDELGEDDEDGDDRRRSQAHDDRRTDVGRPGDDVVDGKDRDDAQDRDDPEAPLVERLLRGCRHGSTPFRGHHRPMRPVCLRGVFAVVIGTYAFDKHVRQEPNAQSSVGGIGLDAGLGPADDIVRRLTGARAGPAECQSDRLRSGRQCAGTPVADTFDEVDRFDLTGLGEQDAEACDADPRAIVAGAGHSTKNLRGFAERSPGHVAAPCLQDFLEAVDVEQDDRQWAAVSRAPGNLRDEQTAPEVGPLEAGFCVAPAERDRTEYLGLFLCDVVGGHDEFLNSLLGGIDSPVASDIVVLRRITSQMTIVPGTLT